MDRRTAQAIDAAKLYYGRGVGQDAIAQALGVSRPTVSKLLALARERGFVHVSIHDPRELSSELGERLRERLGLVEVRLAAGHDDPEAPHEHIGAVGARLVTELVGDATTLGIGWGGPVHAVGRYLAPCATRRVEVVQLQGGVPEGAGRLHDHETMVLFGEAFDARVRSLFLPLYFDDPAVKQAVTLDRHISDTLVLGGQVDVAVFTVLGVDEQSAAIALGYLDDEGRRSLLEHAVAELCGRHITQSGQTALPQLDERTLSIYLERLREVRSRVCVAAGRASVRPIAAAVAGGFVSHLVTDIDTAELLLRHLAEG